MSHQEHQNELGLDHEYDLDTLLANIDTLESDPKLWPKTLHDLMCVMESQIKHRHPEHAKQAHTLARSNVLAIAHYLGGRQLYLPRDDRLQRALRDHLIYERYRGRANHDSLAAEYGLTTIQIYNIVAQQRKLHTARIQPQLFS
jgi:Mor family transcriptional regulator